MSLVQCLCKSTSCFCKGAGHLLIGIYCIVPKQLNTFASYALLPWTQTAIDKKRGSLCRGNNPTHGMGRRKGEKAKRQKGERLKRHVAKRRKGDKAKWKRKRRNKASERASLLGHSIFLLQSLPSSCLTSFFPAHVFNVDFIVVEPSVPHRCTTRSFSGAPDNEDKGF